MSAINVQERISTSMKNHVDSLSPKARLISYKIVTFSGLSLLYSPLCTGNGINSRSNSIHVIGALSLKLNIRNYQAWLLAIREKNMSFDARKLLTGQLLIMHISGKTSIP